MKTLHMFGDSFVEGYGLNPYEKNLGILLKEVWNFDKVENHALAGGSNYRTVRKIFETNFQPNDIAIVGWTEANRFEFPVIDIDNNSQKPSDQPEIYDYYTTQRFLPNQNTNVEQIKNLSNILYSNFVDPNYSLDYFRILFTAAEKNLNDKKVNWFHFFAWDWWYEDLKISWNLQELVDNGKYIKNIREHLTDDDILPCQHWSQSGNIKVAEKIDKFVNSLT